ncbi:hypothetical protein WMY93_016544 [Mugilogobius chulae]|uniref:IRG-type G domain-containing protein n=1 Tax=Mugilogobius chulae TaxID=88201 RepID=A0AAW0NQK1_9GOBI
MADQISEEVQTALQNKNHEQAAKKALEYLEWTGNYPLNIAITGESGSGKSTLVNAFRGIRNKTEGAAPTGVTETTMEPTEYEHPHRPSVKIWDLPGVGTTKFKARKYLRKMKFEKYDFFIIVSDTRFRENDAKLAKKILKMKKKFYFIRSKTDQSIQGEKESDPNLKEEDLLTKIRDDCTERKSAEHCEFAFLPQFSLFSLYNTELVQLGIESPKVFLVSGLKLHLYDFEKLRKTLQEELPEHQRDVLLLSLPVVSLDVIEQKKKALGARIKWFVIASAAIAAVPVPGLSESIDLGIIVKFALDCRSAFGLTPDSLEELSTYSQVPLEELKSKVRSLLAVKEVTVNLVLHVLTMSSAYIAATVLEEGAKFVPVIGTLAAMGISSFATYQALTYILKSLAEDAMNSRRTYEPLEEPLDEPLEEPLDEPLDEPMNL